MTSGGDRRTVATTHPCPHCRGTGLVVDIDPGALVAAIASVVEGQDFIFNTHELFEHVITVGGVLTTVLADVTPKRLGKMLRRITGKEFNGVRVEHIGADRDGAIWQIVRVEQTRQVYS